MFGRKKIETKIVFPCGTKESEAPKPLTVEDVVTCDICGCAVLRNKAHKQPSRVVTECGINFIPNLISMGHYYGSEEKIEKVYHCKACHLEEERKRKRAEAKVNTAKKVKK